MRKFLFVFILLISGLQIYSQSVLLEEDIAGDTTIPKTGPNRTNFYHFYLELSFAAGNSEGKGNDIIYGVSNDFGIGLRYKLKIAKFYAIGYNLCFNFLNFSLAQNDSKTFPDSVNYKKERIGINGLGFSVYNRFNYGRRGDYIGKFIDIGVYGDMNIYYQYFRKDKNSDGVTRSYISGLDYLEPYNYGLYGQIGFNRYVLFCRYRISDMFKDKYKIPGVQGKLESNFAEFPRYLIGFQIGLHK